MHTCIYGLQGFLIIFIFTTQKEHNILPKVSCLYYRVCKNDVCKIDELQQKLSLHSDRQQTIIFKKEKHILRHVKFKGKLFSYRQIMIQSSVRLYTSKAFNNIFNLVNTGIFCNILKSKRLVYQKNKILMQFFILSKCTIFFFLQKVMKSEYSGRVKSLDFRNYKLFRSIYIINVCIQLIFSLYPISSQRFCTIYYRTFL